MYYYWRKYDHVNFFQLATILAKVLVKRSGNFRKIHFDAKSLPNQGEDTWLVKTVWIRGEADPNLFFKAVRMFLMRLFHRKNQQN